MRKLLLAGSGEFTNSMITVDEYCLSLIQQDNLPQRVAIIPTAAGLEKSVGNWIVKGLSYFAKLNFEANGVRVFKREDTDDQKAIDTLKSSSYLYFSGGNPGYLLKTIKNSMLWNTVSDLYSEGRILAGSSAGAMVMGTYTLANAPEIFGNGNTPIWEDGIGIIDFAIIPHFNKLINANPQLLKEIILSSPTKVRQKWIGIDEDTAILIFNEHKVRVMGKGSVHVYMDDKEEIHHSGSSFIF